MFRASLCSSSGEQTIQKTACGECLQHLSYMSPNIFRSSLTCFVRPFWHMEFWGSSWLSGKICTPRELKWQFMCKI